MCFTDEGTDESEMELTYPRSQGRGMAVCLADSIGGRGGPEPCAGFTRRAAASRERQLCLAGFPGVNVC